MFLESFSAGKPCQCVISLVDGSASLQSAGYVPHWHSKHRDHHPLPGNSSLKSPLALGLECPLCYSKQPQSSELFLVFSGSLIPRGRWRLVRESPSPSSQPGTDRDISYPRSHFTVLHFTHIRTELKLLINCWL